MSDITGLFFLPNLDMVFDLGYISLKESGEILIHDDLDEHALLGVSPSLTVNLDEQHQENLDYHLRVVFKH